MALEAQIAVAGGGCVGALAAGLCAAQGAAEGARVLLVDPQPPLAPLPAEAEPAARVVALAPRIEQALRAAGVPTTPWVERSGQVRRMQVQAAGRGQIEFGAAESGGEPLARIVEVGALQRALETWAEAQGVRRLEDRVQQRVAGAPPAGEPPASALAPAVAAAPSNLTLELASGLRLSAGLWLACDGAESRLRRLAGMDLARRDYGQAALVARLRFAEAPADCARQTMGIDGVLGVLPLADGSHSAVWSLPAASAAHWRGVSGAEFASGLNLALGAPWGEATLLGPRVQFPLRELHAPRLDAPGLALLGDAAHTVHPLAGLGLNLGLADALSLADALAGAAGRGRPPQDPATLRRWSRERQAAVAPYREFINLLAGLGERHPWGWRGVAAGFGLADGLGPLKQLFAERARSGSLG